MLQPRTRDLVIAQASTSNDDDDFSSYLSWSDRRDGVSDRGYDAADEMDIDGFYEAFVDEGYLSQA